MANVQQDSKLDKEPQQREHRPQTSHLVSGEDTPAYTVLQSYGLLNTDFRKASFDEAKLVENIRAFVEAVAKAKPTGAKGAYMKKISLSSTMGPGVSVSVDNAAGN